MQLLLGWGHLFHAQTNRSKEKKTPETDNEPFCNTTTQNLKSSHSTTWEKCPQVGIHQIWSEYSSEVSVTRLAGGCFLCVQSPGCFNIFSTSFRNPDFWWGKRETTGYFWRHCSNICKCSSCICDNKIRLFKPKHDVIFAEVSVIPLDVFTETSEGFPAAKVGVYVKTSGHLPPKQVF